MRSWGADRASSCMAISLLTLFNALAPKDRGSRRSAHDLAYGPHARQKLDIYTPRRGGKHLPVIVFFYGGSWSDGTKEDYHFAGRALAALGYLVVVPDYRLVPEVEYPGFLRDCADAVAWVVQQIGAYGGDPRRVALAGHSAGAYNALMVVLDERYLKARGVLKNIRAVAGLSGPYDFYPFDGPISIRVFGAVAAPDDTQPVNHVASPVPAVFLGHGAEDELVHPRNSRALRQRLEAAGVPVTLEVYPRLKHAEPLLALSRPFRWRAPVIAQLRSFFEAML